MRRTAARTISLLILLAMLLGPSLPATGDNGEYVEPESTRRPRPGGPGTPPVAGPRTPTGPSAVPTPRLPGRGASTPGSVEGAPTGTVTRETALPWDVVWALVGDAHPAPPPPLDPECRAALLAALRAALSDESDEVRSCAGFALGRGGSPGALLQAFQADPGFAETSAILGAGIGAGRADADPEVAARVREAIRAVFDDADRGVAGRALAVLGAGFSGLPLAGPLLETLGRMEEGDLRGVVLFALGRTGHPGAAEILDGETLPPEKEAKEADDPVRRTMIVSALAGAPGAELDLLRRLGDPSPEVAAAAALSLRGVASRPNVNRSLRAIARSGTPRRRSAALLALTLAGDPEAAALARASTRDPLAVDDGTAALAALCLGLLRSATDGEALLDAVASPDLPDDLRAACAVAAGLARAREGSERLRKALPRIRVPLLRARVLFGLALLEGEEAVEIIVREIGGREDPAARRILMDALGRTGGEVAVETLVEGVGDVYTVNRRAAAALFRIDPARATAEVVARLRDRENRNARRFGAIVAGRALDPRMPSVLAEALLSAGLARRSPMLNALLYLESEALYRR